MSLAYIPDSPFAVLRRTGTSGKNRRLAVGTLSVDFKKPWNFLAKMPAESHRDEADIATNQIWWRRRDSNPGPKVLLPSVYMLIMLIIF